MSGNECYQKNKGKFLLRSGPVINKAHKFNSEKVFLKITNKDFLEISYDRGLVY